MKIESLRQGDRFRVHLKSGGYSLPFIFGHIEGTNAVCLFADGPLQGEQAEIAIGAEVETES